MAKKKFNRLLNTLINVSTCILALALFLSDIAIYINPEHTWIPAFAGLGYVPLFVANFLAAILLLAFRKRICLLPSLAILIGWSNISNTFSMHASGEAPLKNDRSLRIMTWNTHYFNYMQHQSVDSSRLQMLDMINEYAPDVVCIQEFSLANIYSASMEKKIAQRLNMPYWYLQDMESDTRGMVIYSKYPIVFKKLIPFQDKGSGNQAILADLKINDRRVRIYSVHLESIRLNENQVGYIREITKGKKEDIRPGKVIAGQLKRAFIKRAEQVKIIRTNTDTCRSAYIICGDFNDPPSSYSFHQMKKGLQNTFQQKGTGIIPITYHRSVFKYQIDHILASKDLQIDSHYIIRRKLSDHYPVICDFRFK